jgi:hypothetical protein
LGLTQDCRHLRTEFYPLFRKHHLCIMLDFSDLEQYFRDWIMLDGQQPGNVHANIKLVFSDTPYCELEMRDILLLVGAAPGIPVETEYGEGQKHFKIELGSQGTTISPGVSAEEFSEPTEDIATAAEASTALLTYMSSRSLRRTVYIADDFDDKDVYRTAVVAWEEKLGIRCRVGDRAMHEMRADKA